MDGSGSELMANVCQGVAWTAVVGDRADGQCVPGGGVDHCGGRAGLMAAAVGTAV